MKVTFQKCCIRLDTPSSNKVLKNVGGVIGGVGGAYLRIKVRDEIGVER